MDRLRGGQGADEGMRMTAMRTMVLGVVAAMMMMMMMMMMMR